MYCKCGTFEFEPWECNIAVFRSAILSPRGFRRGDNVQFTFDFEIVANGAEDIETRLQEINNAFVDGASCGLVDDAGDPIASHWLPNTTDAANNYTNTQIISKRLPPTVNGEFVSGRKGQIVVASFFTNSTSQVIDFQDKITRHGNAGAQYSWKRDERLSIGWYPEEDTPYTLQHLTQSGYAIGEDTWPLPPPPIYSTPFEDNTKRTITHTGPQRYPEGYLGFRVDWTYHYTLPTYDDFTGPYIY